MNTALVDKRLGSPSMLLVGTTAIMVAFGLLMILSASSIESLDRTGSSFSFFNRQAIGAGIGVIAAILLARTDHRKLGKAGKPLWLLSLGLLILVMIPGIGQTRGGSQRWLIMGPLSIQPSELAKLALILLSAATFEAKQGKLADPSEFGVLMVPGGITCLLILIQPDLGTALICAIAVFIVMYLAGVRGRHMAALGSVGLVATFGLILNEGYRRERFFSFLNPWADPLNTGYQTIQGQIALGSGGVLGVGLGASRQKWLYVPNAHTDFIYAIVGEEMGLVGTVLVMLLFALFVFAGIRIAKKAQDRMGMMLAGGITGWIAIQALINMGAITGLLPITGVPLPFLSFGGSALVTTLAAVGILLSVDRSSRSKA